MGCALPKSPQRSEIRLTVGRLCTSNSGMVGNSSTPDRVLKTMASCEPRSINEDHGAGNVRTNHHGLLRCGRPWWMVPLRV